MAQRLIGTDSSNPKLPVVVIDASVGTGAHDLAAGNHTHAGGSGSMSGPTVDTGALYRIIMFSDGTVRAIPFAATAPPTPTGFARSIRVGWVNLSWSAVPGAVRYIVRRDGAQIAVPTSPSYRDSTVVVGTTYSYTVQALDTYGLRSAETAPLTAFIDPALNVAPTMEVRSWPTTIASGHRGFIRVNAFDADAQALAYTLGVDVGSLISTPDPSVWILEVP